MLPTDWGNMASDGVARIFPGAFASPTELASVLIHEKFHFRQNITANEGDAKTPAELEVEAYKLEQGLMNDPDNVLGYTQKIRERQKSRLTDMLIEKKALAKKQRAQVDRARGLPIDAFSIVSLPKDEINRLIQQAKDQIEIAQRDHDERLKRTWVDLAHRSCANPGSITQFVLDSLPRLHRRDNGGGVPGGLGDCGTQVYILLAYEANAEQIRNASTPHVPADLGQVSKPIAVQPISRPVPAVARTPFWPVLPRLQRYAVAACRSSGPVPIDTSLTQPRPPFKFSRDIDDRTAAELSAGLGNCEGQLFRRLIEVIRSGQGDRITAQWVQETAAGYRTAPGASPGGGAPPRDREPPPDRKHPDIVIPKPPWENRLKGRAK